ncbi:hypothetical protein TSOC111612_17190 [Tsukamurella ocularis]
MFIPDIKSVNGLLKFKLRPHNGLDFFRYLSNLCNNFLKFRLLIVAAKKIFNTNLEGDSLLLQKLGYSTMSCLT